MAIGLRVRDPLKTISLTCERGLDPAIPLLDLEEYETSRDPALVRPAPGQTLTWFTLMPLAGDYADSIRAISEPLRYRVALARSCVACSDPAVLPPEAWEQTREGPRLRPEALGTLPDCLVSELGELALRLGDLSVGESLRSVAPAGSRAIRRQRSATSAGSAGGSSPAPRGV